MKQPGPSTPQIIPAGNKEMLLLLFDLLRSLLQSSFFFCKSYVKRLNSTPWPRILSGYVSNQWPHQDMCSRFQISLEINFHVAQGLGYLARRWENPCRDLQIRSDDSPEVMHFLSSRTRESQVQRRAKLSEAFWAFSENSTTWKIGMHTIQWISSSET